MSFKQREGDNKVSLNIIVNLQYNGAFNSHLNYLLVRFDILFACLLNNVQLTPPFQWDWIDSLPYLVRFNLSRFRRKKKHLKFYNSNIDTYKPIKLSFKILSDILQGVKWSYSIFLRFLFFRQPSQPTFFDSILKVTSFIYEFTHKISGSWLKITVNLSELEKLCVNNGIVKRMDVSC